MKTKIFSRRHFLRAALATTGSALALPTILPASVFGAESPSHRIHLAHIGVGGQGGGLLRAFLGLPGSKTVAVCDCFTDRRESNAALVNQTYGDKVCTPYRDLREMLAREDIDAVVVATPDHWHVPAAILAVRAGKSVYVEKPLGISIEQNRALRAACQLHRAVFQYGTQQRSQSHIRFGTELVRNGRIGKLLSVEVVSPASSAGGSTEPIPVPAGFDYDRWLGGAPWAPYTKDRCTSAGGWFCSDYALGFIAGWGAHPLDVAVWGCGDTAEAVPVEFEGSGAFPTEGLFDTATAWDVRGHYANGVAFRFRGPGGDLTTYTGEKGKVLICRGWLRTEPESLRDEVIGPEELHLYSSDNHYRNFVDCVRSRRRTISPIEVAVWSDTISHLSDIAIRTGRKVKWDPHQERILDDDSAARRLTRAMRAPWTV